MSPPCGRFVGTSRGSPSCAGAGPADRRRPPRRVPRGRGLRVRLLGPRRGDDGHPRRAQPADPDPPRHDPPRAGRRVHGRCPRPADRPRRGRDGDPRAGRDQPRHRRRRRLPRPRADGRDHRPDGLGQAPQGGPPGRRHRPDVRPGHEVEHAGRAGRRDPRDRPQGVPGRRAGEARARPTSSCPRTSRRCRPSRATRPVRWSRPGPTSPSRPTRRSPTPPGSSPASERPIVLAGNGVLRRRASEGLRALARGLHVPVAVTFMGKGAIDDRSHLSLMAVGLQARDHVLTGFDRADLVVSVGYDLVEYAPARWNPDGTKPIVHIDTQPAEVDADYRPAVELIGDIDGTLERLLGRSSRWASAVATRPSATSRRRPWSTPTCGPPCCATSRPTRPTTATRSSPRRRSPTCAGRSAPTTSSSPTSGPTRSGSPASTRPTSRTR